MLKTFTVAPEQDSVRTAFSNALCAGAARLTLERRLAAEYLLKQDGLPVAILRGKELVCGGEHFAVIPFLPSDWAEQGVYALSNANVPYWGGEQRLRSLDDLLCGLSCGLPITEALDYVITLQGAADDEFFAGIPEVAYTGQQPVQPKPNQPKIYPWTFWYRGGDGEPHQLLLEATYEDAQRVWDKLSTTLDMTSKRP